MDELTLEREVCWRLSNGVMVSHEQTLLVYYLLAAIVRH